jgi:hypothetical protein
MCGPWQGVAVGDSDDDGKQEIILADWDSATNGVKVFEYSGSGGLSSTNPSTTASAQFSPEEPAAAVIVGDQDNDGKGEIIVGMGGRNSFTFGYNSGIEVWETDGDDSYNMVWEFKESYAAVQEVMVRAVKVGNRLDGDSSREIVFATQSVTTASRREVFIYEATADNTYTQRARFTVGTPNSIHGLEVFDIDGDGDEEVFLATGDGHIYLTYSTAGNTYSTNDLGVAGGGSATACFDVDAVTEEGWSDVDNDKDFEFFAVCNDDKVWRAERTGSGLTSTDFTWTDIFTSDNTNDIYAVVALGVSPPNPNSYDNDNYFDVFAGEYQDSNDELFVVEYNTLIPEFQEIAIPIISTIPLFFIFRKRRKTRNQK